MEIIIELLDEMCNPQRMTDGSVGFDIRSSKDIDLLPQLPTLVPAGFKIQLPYGYEAQIRPRSGMALKQGITILNTPGTIDSDYVGIVGVILFNTTKEKIKIEKYSRIAQMVINKIEIPAVIYGKVSETKRGEGGFGSTGEK